MINFDLELDKIIQKGLFRKMNYIETAQDTRVLINGKEVLLLSSNNYLGLCNSKRLKNAGIKGIEKFGVGSGGSRLTTGSTILHKELEDILAVFKGKQSAILFNTGYMANVGVITALTDRDWIIFCDRLNHASIIEGCMLSRAKLVIYKHCDVDDLEKKLKKYKGINRLIVTDTVFSMDGDIAPLDKIVAIAKENNTLLMVDEAHATGVFGKFGRGISEIYNVCDEIDISVGTLSKALASEGGFAVGNKNVIEYIRQKAKSFIYSTALSPQTISVSIEAVNIVMEDKKLRRRLLERAVWFRNELKSLGANIIEGETPIIPIIIGDAKESAVLSEKLLENNIYIPAIRQPTVPKGTSRLRISLMASHTIEDLKYVINVFNELGIVGV